MTNLFRRTAPGIVHLSLDAPNGKRETLKVTSEHPFFVKGKGWTGVRKLVPGDQIISGKGGFLAIANMRSETQPTLVYNFEVAQNHNYFAGGEGALAHNAGYGNWLGTKTPAYLYKLVDRTTGELLKFGISNNCQRRYSKKYLDVMNADLIIIENGSRYEMRAVEKRLNKFFRPLPLVKRF